MLLIFLSSVLKLANISVRFFRSTRLVVKAVIGLRQKFIFILYCLKFIRGYSWAQVQKIVPTFSSRARWKQLYNDRINLNDLLKKIHITT